MKALATTVTALVLLASSTAGRAPASECAAMMHGRRCCCHHSSADGTGARHNEATAAPARCCGAVHACSSALPALPASANVRADAPAVAIAPALPAPPPLSTGGAPLCVRSRGPPGLAHALYRDHCSWLI